MPTSAPSAVTRKNWMKYLRSSEDTPSPGEPTVPKRKATTMKNAAIPTLAAGKRQRLHLRERMVAILTPISQLFHGGRAVLRHPGHERPSPTVFAFLTPRPVGSGRGHP